MAFRSDMKCMEVEEKLLKGVKWHGNKEVVLYGYRLDKPTLHVRVLGVPPDIPACEMERIFSQYGQVTSLHRGSHPLISKGEEGGEDWVWDGQWNIYIKVAEEKTLPSNIIANDEHWEVQFRGSVQACYKCLATDHLSWRCPAKPRPKTNVNWVPFLGQHVDMVFPISEGDMTQPDFNYEQMASQRSQEEEARRNGARLPSGSNKKDNNWKEKFRQQEEVIKDLTEKVAVQEASSQTRKNNR